MENRAHALAAGLFVLILGLATALGVWWFRQDREEVSYYLLETRSGVGGLNNQAVVRYRGIRAGRVEDIGIDPRDGRFIIVRISLDEDITLTQGTTARLTMQGITGLTYISLDDDGNNPAPLMAALEDSPGFIMGHVLMAEMSLLFEAKETVAAGVAAAETARSLGGGTARVLVTANPCFGLDFAAVASIHAQLTEARNRGVAVLLVSEDLDELLALADRVLVISHGQFVYETTPAQADVRTIGHHMAGH